MKRVTGIGGIFFKSLDPKSLGAWYRDHLGLDVANWGGTVNGQAVGASAVMSAVESVCTPVNDSSLPAQYRNSIYDCQGQAAAHSGPWRGVRREGAGARSAA